MKKTSLIFDLDNTLIRCGEYYNSAKQEFANLASERTGISQDIALSILNAIDTQSIKIDGFGRSRFPKSFEAASVAIDVLTGNPPNMEHAELSWDIGDSVFTAPYSLYEGAEEALEYVLSEGYKLFMCTKGDVKVQLRKVKINKLDRFFPKGHIYIDVTKNESHFKRIMTDHELKKSQTIIVGDSLKDDIGSAVKLKLKSILVFDQQNNGYAYEDETHESTWAINEIKELPNLLSSLKLQ